METSVLHFEVDTGHWTGCAMQEDTSQEQSAMDYMDNKWTSSIYTIFSYILAKHCGQQLLVLHRTRWTRESEEVVTHRLPTPAASYNLRLRIIILTII